MSYETLLIEKEGRTLTVKLNRPSKFNAMNFQMIEELSHLFQDLRKDPDTRTVIFTGNGKAFSGGADIEALEDMIKNPGLIRGVQNSGQEFMRALENLEQITFAAINGPAVGAGLALAMACDFRIMADKTYLSIPEAAVGIFFTWGCTPRLVKLIGPSMAKELIMTCEMVKSERALGMGLVNRVVEDDLLIATVMDMVKQIESKAPLAIRMTKKLVNASTAVGFGDVLVCEPELVEKLYFAKDPMEGVQAFVEKRTPQFTGE
jgi:enoyl-CoA hydratase/carnithine racemase